MGKKLPRIDLVASVSLDDLIYLVDVSDTSESAAGSSRRAKIGDVASAVSDAPVDSVNGQTGAVTLSAADVNALPDTYTAPIQDVNGQTGSVTVTVPVDNVNGQTGTVSLSASDVGAAPTGHGHSTVTTSVAGFMSAPDKTKLNGIEGGAEVNPADTDAVSEGTNNLYHTATRASNAAPVQTVNGQTGAVTVSVPVDSVNGQTGSVSLTSSDVGALASIDGVANAGGDVNLVPGGAISLSPDNTNNQITISETHSTETNNPHNVTAAQVGAPTSLDGVSNAGGDIDLVAGGDVSLSPDNANNKITISVSVPVDSVAGKTGAVTLSASDVGALPDTYTAPVQSVAGKTGSVTLSGSDVGLGNVPNTDATNASNISSGTLPDARIAQSGVTQHAGALTWTNLGISQGDVSASDVGLGNVDNKALSNVGWGDLAISQSDVSKTDVGLGNVPNENATDPANLDQAGAASGDVLKWDGVSWGPGGTSDAPVDSVAGKTGAVTLNNGDVGLGNVTNDAQVKVAGDTMQGNLSMDTHELRFGGTFKMVYNSTNDSLDIEVI